MSITSSWFIPSEKFKQFDEILKNTGGRYLSNPTQNRGGSMVHVHFEYGDYEEHNRQWELITTPIKEVDSTSKWCKMLRMVKRFF
jgi:predicted SprT family Zn-dependent metalloprotease